MVNFSYLQILLIVAGILLLLAIAFFLGRWLRAGHIRSERTDATVRSRSVLLGEIYEKIAPFLPDFPYKPKDMVFLGKGVDYIVFDGLSAGRVEKIVFLELKSGASRLSKNEILIEEAVRSKRVEFRTERLEGF